MSRTIVYGEGDITFRCKRYSTAIENQKWDEGASDGFLGFPHSQVYRIPDLRAAYDKGYEYGSNHPRRLKD